MGELGKIRINVDDIIGKRLGKLEVISYAGCRYERTKGGMKLRHFYSCYCECGIIKLVRRGQLTSEIVHSCGCKRRDFNGHKDEKQC